MALLTKKFKQEIDKVETPFTDLGEFVYHRTYSRWLEKEKRREEWKETVIRSTEYSVGLLKKHYDKMGIKYTQKELREEAEKLAQGMYELKTFLSGRTMWVGGTDVADKFPTANYNCSFLVLDKWEDFEEMFYLLMVGTGAGIRILKEDVEKFKEIRTDVKMKLKPFKAEKKDKREDFTSLIIEGEKAVIKVGDSKEGWVNALGLYFRILTDFLYNGIDEIEVDFDYVRPAGERLKTFGGTASGHDSIKRMFKKIDKVIKKTDGKIRPIHALDIATIIGENVVVGGVRRTSLITLFDEDDDEVRNAKNELFIQDEEGNWEVNKEIENRRMSNNSIFYRRKPSPEVVYEQVKNMYLTGEPAFINEIAGKKRRADFKGVNPCAEILLDDEQLCNLTTINLMGYVKDGKIMTKEMIEGFEIITRAGIRMTLVDLELLEWDKKQKRDRLIGVSMTGWQDLVEAVEMSRHEQVSLLRRLRKVIKDEARRYSRKLGISEPLLATTIKPEGTISQLPTVSSGLHYSHSPYHIRRVRINKDDKLVEVAKKLGWNMSNEVGETDEELTTVVIDFPVKSPAKRTKGEVGAIEQLETYKMFMENFVDHNASITVHMREEEIEEVANWIYVNWDIVVGVTFLAYSDHFYELAPYEEITKEEYEEMVKGMDVFDREILLEVEKDRGMTELVEDCETGG